MGSARTQSTAKENRNLIPHTPTVGIALSAMLPTKLQPLCNPNEPKRRLTLLQSAVTATAGLNLLKTVGQKVAAAAQQAYWWRRMDLVGEAAEVLSRLAPFGHNAILGEYFRALCLKREGDTTASAAIFERLSEGAPDAWKAKILLSAGAIHYDRGDYDSALRFYGECLRAARDNDLVAAVGAQRMIAQVKVLNGDLGHAMGDFSSLCHLAVAVGRFQPFLLHDCMNAYAYVLTLAGRISEARDMCRVVLASPFAPAYPEWRATGLEAGLRLSPADLLDKKIFIIDRQPDADENSLATARPQNVAVLVPKPGTATLHTDAPSVRRRQPRVLSFRKWKKKSRIDAGNLEPYPPRPLEDHTIAELRVRMGRSVFKDDLEKTKLVRMILAVEAIARDVV